MFLSRQLEVGASHEAGPSCLRAIRLASSAILLQLALLSILPIFQTSLFATDLKPPKRVLILYSFDKEQGIYLGLDQALRSNLRSLSPDRVEFYTEYLDLIRFPDPEHTATLVKLLRLRLAENKPDLIIASSYSAVDFLLKDAKDLFPGVPIVALFNERRAEAVAAALKAFPSQPRITGLKGRDDPTLTLDLALRLQPDTENVAVVVGSSSVEKFWLQQLQNEFAKYSGRPKFIYLTDLPMSEMLKELATLPSHTIILFSYFFEDSTGQSFSSEEALDLITSSVHVPVYGMLFPYLDHGVVGGRVSDPEQVGATLAAMAVRVLDGENPSQIPMIVDPSLRDVVDWRQLKRWGISERRVPEGTRVLHKEPSAWDRYGIYIAFAILLFVVQASLILVLLLERQRRRRAEKSLTGERRFSDALFEALPGHVFVQDENLNHIRWNKNVEKDARFHPASAEPLGNVAESSKEPLREAVRTAFDTGTAETEVEMLVKDGKTTPFYFNALRVEVDGERYIIGAGIDISERKRMEQELRLSEERFASAFENAPIGMALVAPDGKYLKVNRALCDMLGYEAEQLQTKSFSEITHPEDRSADREYAQRMLRSEIRPYLIREKRYLHKSGRVLRVVLAISLVRDKEGNPLHFIAQVQDVTEQRKIEASIRAIVEGVRAGSSTDFSTSMAAQLAKATGADHAIIGELIEGDEPVVRSLGISLNRTVAENITYKLAGTPCNEMARTGFACSYPSDVTHRFPSDLMLQQLGVQGYAGVPLFNSRQRVVGIMAAMFNEPIENPRFVESVLQVFSHWAASEVERNRTETELRLAEERFSKAFQSSPEGCAIATLNDGRFIDANDAFLRMMGYSRSEVIGNTSAVLHIWKDPQERSALTEKLLQTFRVREEAVQFRTKSGAVLDIRFSGEIIQLQGVPCLLGVARDVTEQNALEEQFRQAQKMEAMGRLAGGVAHDFNNLLGVIIGYSELLATNAPDGSVSHKRIVAIKQAAQRAASLTTQLLAYSRKQALDLRVVNMNLVVAETERLLRRLVGEDIELAVTQDPNLGHVKADSGQMVQVIMNLAVNARDAMPGGGKLTIDTANVVVDEGTPILIRPGSYVKLTVRDNGMGMDESTKTRIFEPFFTTKPPGEGTGLGLATVYGIVEQSGGAILVTSEVGLGTTFEIYLPRVDDVFHPKVVNLPPLERGSASETILLVEDELSLRDVLYESLRAEGYELIVAVNGADALRFAEQYQGAIHLLLTDVIMPSMSGPELAQSLRATRPETKVLYISGYTADKLTRYPELDPEVALLRKPFKLMDLSRKIRSLLTPGPKVPQLEIEPLKKEA